MKLCLNSIVKNESARIERMLDSVCQFIDYWVIVDTGSTDDTKEKIKAYFDYHRVPGELHEAPFHDWSQARNAALAHARHAWCKDPALFDYLLLVDADMQLVMRDRIEFEKLIAGGASYDMMQHAGSVHYLNRRLVKADATGQYLGVTHEYLNVEAAAGIPERAAFFIDHADGANRPEKFKRDIRLLRRGLQEEPNNERYMFYLANSYRDAGEHDRAIKWYERRIAAGGWDEEMWQARLNVAYCHLAVKNEAGFILNALEAYKMRPTRVEPLYDMAHYYREKGWNAPAALFAEAGMAIPKPNDALFVNDFVYKAGCANEFAITGFYVPSRRQKAFEVNDQLSLFPTGYNGPRQTARQNMYWFLPRLGDLCPSFSWKKIDFTPEDGWTAMNPSVTNWNGYLYAIVRTVNYTITPEGRYLIREVEDDGKIGCNANAEYPINTRNFLVRLDENLSLCGDKTAVREVLPPSNFPKCWPLVVGFEDMRLIPGINSLWFSATCRQLHEDGNCEQVFGRIEPTSRGLRVADDYKRMLRQPRGTEKNWAPLPWNGAARFMWRPGEIVNSNGVTVRKNSCFFDNSTISGGSQLIDWNSGYLALVHEAAVKPFEPHGRYYWHRFIKYAYDGQPLAISTPFVFNEKEIEFAAGMCWHPYYEKLVISYGFKDAEARIATISVKDVENFLCPVPR